MPELRSGAHGSLPREAACRSLISRIAHAEGSRPYAFRQLPRSDYQHLRHAPQRNWLVWERRGRTRQYGPLSPPTHGQRETASPREVD